MHLTATLKLKKLKEREAHLKSEIDTLNTKLRQETATLVTSLLDHHDILTLPQNTLLGVLDETFETLTKNPQASQKFEVRGNKVRQRLKPSRTNARTKRTPPLAKGEGVFKDMDDSTRARQISSKRPKLEEDISLSSSKISTQESPKSVTSHA